jgi:hypothetical protein
MPEVSTAMVVELAAAFAALESRLEHVLQKVRPRTIFLQPLVPQ